ncbi:hypothetical protein HOY34_04640 [Xinfangfangia sp. D13-10-4-6]|uniref:hypothetical protein n=1 Tax=Pseudogemmobacter hezensis TaxID=2737662 RepID=UPI001554DD4C|nr:hypothetical protein [Pseudogemmobacter hezensis]NPD14487.1 hypothetical protein [Pseudogemmobacter hezensis]
MQFLDPFHPMFDRPIARLLTSVLPILWSGLEFFVFGSPLFGAAFLAAGLYAAYMFYIVRPKGPPDGSGSDRITKDRD